MNVIVTPFAIGSCTSRGCSNVLPLLFIYSAILKRNLNKSALQKTRVPSA